MSSLTAPSPLPTPVEIRELLEGVLGRDIEVVVGAPAVNPAEAPGAVVGVYTDDQKSIRALLLMDLELAAYAGAALALVPVSQAEQAIVNQALPENLYENIAEVLNIAASLFNKEGVPHVKLFQAFQPDEVLPPDAAKWVLAFVRRLDMKLDVNGYGPGRISVLAI